MNNNRVSNNAILDRINKTASTSKVNRQSNQTIPASFDKILQSKTDNVTISKHAEKRLEMRNISLSKANLEKISSAIDKADQKGVKDALIIFKNNAFITNVKSKTIITAANVDDLETKVITNIDGVVLV